MIDLDSNCHLASQVRLLISSGQITEAKRLAADFFRNGKHSEELSRIVAPLLDPGAPRRRGRPRGSQVGQQWGTVGSQFAQMRANGIKHEQAIEMLADRFSSSNSAIEKIVRSYRHEMTAANADMQEWYEEFDSWPQHKKDEYYAEIEAQTAAYRSIKSETVD